jgi:hypothetical protein
LDADLALLYRVSTKNLNKAVKRNAQRFPGDFMFQLKPEEAKILRFQPGTSSVSHGGRRYLPFAFTEQGIAMLSSVLHSHRACKLTSPSCAPSSSSVPCLRLTKTFAAKSTKRKSATTPNSTRFRYTSSDAGAPAGICRCLCDARGR